MKGWGHIVNKNPKTAAFTIVELLIVIVIIAVLAAIVIVGYGAVIGNANDKAVQSDLTKFSDVMNLYNLDNQQFPGSSITGGISSYGFAVTQGSYAVAPAATYNLDYCYVLGGTSSYGLVALSKSGRIFYVTNSSGGVKQYNGSWETDITGGQMCHDIDASFNNTSRGYASNDTTTGPWRTWTGVGTTHAIVTNLITNPSFETNATDWNNYSGFSTPTRVTTTAWSGNASLSAVGLGTVTTPRVYIDAPASNGDVLSLTFRVRSDGQAATGGYMVAKVVNGASEVSTFYSNTVSWTPDSNGWVNVTGTFTVPAGGTGVRLAIGLTSAVNYSGTMGIDGVMLVKSSSVPAYADGSSSGWSWTGTVNNSTSTGPV